MSYVPPYASTFACPQIPINRPLALQYECSGYNIAAPPPHLSLPPPYTALQSQHSQVLTIDSGAVTSDNKSLVKKMVYWHEL